MGNNKPILKIILIALTGLYLLHYFVVPLSVIDGEKAISFFNGQAGEENRITSLDLKQMIPAASASEENEGGESAVPSCRILTYVSPLNLVRQYFRLDRFCRKLTGFDSDASAVLLTNELKTAGNINRLHLPPNSKAARSLFLLCILLCLTAIVLLILTEKTGFITGMAAGFLTAVVHLYTSVSVFRLSDVFGKLKGVEWRSNAGLGTFVKMLDYVHLHKWYIVLLIIPIAILVFSIVGFFSAAAKRKPVVPTPTYPGEMVMGMMRPPDPPEGGLLHGDIIPDTVSGKDNISDSGKIRCIGGQYQGAVFNIKDGEIIKIGSDPQVCNIVFSDPAVPRVSCMITFSSLYKVYTVNNYNAASLDRAGRPIPNNQPVCMEAGNQIQIRTRDGVCCFRFES